MLPVRRGEPLEGGAGAGGRAAKKARRTTPRRRRSARTRSRGSSSSAADAAARSPRRRPTRTRSCARWTAVAGTSAAAAAAATTTTMTTTTTTTTAATTASGMRVPRTLGNVAMHRRAPVAIKEEPTSDDEYGDLRVLGTPSDDEADANDPGAEEFAARTRAPRRSWTAGAGGNGNGNGNGNGSGAGVSPADDDAPSAPGRGRFAVASQWDPTDPGMVTQAKAVMHTSVAPRGAQVPRERAQGSHGRDPRRAEAQKVVLDVRLRASGTGKSLTVGEAEKAVRRWGDGSGRVGKLAKSERPIVAAVNCMALSEPRHVFARIIEALGGVSPAELARGVCRRGGEPGEFGPEPAPGGGHAASARPPATACTACTAAAGSDLRVAPTTPRSPWSSSSSTRWTSSRARRRAYCTSSSAFPRSPGRDASSSASRTTSTSSR